MKATFLSIILVFSACIQALGQINIDKKDSLSDIQHSKNIALVIGTSEYSAWSYLPNPVFDANTVKNILENDYNYLVTSLSNPTKEQILESLSKLNEAFKYDTSNSNLLIFIAGHGGYDDLVTGYIVPSDAKPVATDRFRQSCISHNDLRGMIENIKARHTLVIIDACFGGTFDHKLSDNKQRGEFDENSVIDYKELLERKSSLVSHKYITSGGKEYVPDGRPDQHSPFAYYLISLLKESYENKKPVTFHKLCSSLELLKPEPRVGDFSFSDPGGDFILVPNSYLDHNDSLNSRFCVKPAKITGTQLSSNKSTDVISPRRNILEKIKKRELEILMEENSPPMFFVRNDVNMGFAYEFAKELGKRMNTKIHITSAPFPELINKLNQGHADIVLAGEAMHPDIQSVLWSDPFLETGLCMLVKTGTGYTDYKQIEGKKIGLYKGDESTKEWVLKNIPNAKIIYDEQYEKSWLHILDDNRCDAVIYDYLYASEEIKDFPDLRIRQFNVKPLEYSIIIPDGNRDLLAEINKQIAAIKNSPEYRLMYIKYFTSDARKMSVNNSIDCREPDCHVVRTGETIESIARKYLGSTARTKEIFELNKARLPSIHLLVPGTKLLLPHK